MKKALIGIVAVAVCLGFVGEAWGIQKLRIIEGSTITCSRIVSAEESLIGISNHNTKSPETLTGEKTNPLLLEPIFQSRANEDFVNKLCATFMSSGSCENLSTKNPTSDNSEIDAPAVNEDTGEAEAVVEDAAVNEEKVADEETTVPIADPSVDEPSDSDETSEFAADGGCSLTQTASANPLGLILTAFALLPLIRRRVK